MMHRCLHISEILDLILECVREVERNKKTLVSLARTCHLFSSPALDVLWRDLDSFVALSNICPTVTCPTDDPQWLAFRKYAERVRAFRGRVTASSLEHFPESCLPVLPNLIQLEWNQNVFSADSSDSGISLFKSFAGPTLTTLTLTFMPQMQYSSADIEALADLPRLFPNVTSFNAVPFFWWDRDVPQQVGQSVVQWSRLRTLRTCAMAQPLMDQLFSQKTLQSLHIDYYASSPLYGGRIPDHVRNFTLRALSLSSCIHFFEGVYASPATFKLMLAKDSRDDDATIQLFCLLPLRLDTSRMLSLTIWPTATVHEHQPFNLELGKPLVSAIIMFTALHILDLDYLATAHITDADYDLLARSLTQLRSLKLGTASQTAMSTLPAASIAAVIALLMYCEYLKTLHIMFDATILPPVTLTTVDCKVAAPDELAPQGWGISNRRIAELYVGYSPIKEATIHPIASCLRSILPHLVRIQCRSRHTAWRSVQNLLGSN